jgi:hypothetical protein
MYGALAFRRTAGRHREATEVRSALQLPFSSGGFMCRNVINSTTS